MTREEEKEFLIEHLYKLWECGENTTIISLLSQVADWCDEHPKSPWKDAKSDPPKDMKPVIGYADGIIGVYEYSPEEKIWSIGMLISDAPEYWMSMPETQKGGEE